MPVEVTLALLRSLNELIVLIMFFFFLQAMELVPLRDKALQDERHKQNSNDDLRHKFADQANIVGNYTREKMQVID